ncbi:MAG TPA: hypothetical protein VH420_04405 [Gaiellaceae bacterium]|jgi:hypothetical protein
MSEEEQQPEEREETIEDLDVPEDQAADVAGGRKAGMGQDEV